MSYRKFGGIRMLRIGRLYVTWSIARKVRSYTLSEARLRLNQALAEQGVLPIV